jgi:(1->4)-alpha-D-glucan 1-alpha-D-glucosylmutase
VGGDAAAGALSIAQFHKRMAIRAGTAPHGLTTTATHDTKRGEDARARLLTLSEMAGDWADVVRHWRRLNARLMSDRIQRPSAAHEYMIYQALIGAWPLAGIEAGFVERMRTYVIKAAREGKEETSWTAPNEAYEAALMEFTGLLLDRERSARFIKSFDAFASRVALMGALNGLAQLALKSTMPGVPDFYQGTELWDLSLVDPDNRRPVDFGARDEALRALAQEPDWTVLARDWRTGLIKLALTSSLLALRRALPRVFADGDYWPLAVQGPHRREIIAFARGEGRDAVIVVTGRLFGRATGYGRRWPKESAWNASINLEGFAEVRSVVGGSDTVSRSKIQLGPLLKHVPVALLSAKRMKGSEARAQRPRTGPT